MPEVSDPSKDHDEVVLIGGLNHFGVPDGPARLDDGRNTAFSGGINGIPKREKRVGGHDAPGNGFLRFFNGETRGINPAHLSGADANRFMVPGINDGVGFNVLRHNPCEFERLQSRVIRLFF